MRTLITYLALAATPAIGCPTPDDLSTGIRVTESDGLATLYTTMSPEIVEAVVIEQGDVISRNHLARGVYILRLASVFDGAIDFDSVWLTSYDSPVPELPLPMPGLEQTFNTTIRSFDDTYPETQSQSWGELEEFAAGDCVTAAIYGTIIYESETSRVTETIAYLPDIGIGLLTSYADGDEEPDIYKFIGIEAVK